MRELSRVVLVSHGTLAQSLLENAELLIGVQENVAVYGLFRDMQPEQLREELVRELETHGAENILFLTDLINGSPFNVVASLTEDYEVHHFTGMNLAMVLMALSARKEDYPNIETYSTAVLSEAEKSIIDVGKLLQTLRDEPDEEEDW